MLLATIILLTTTAIPVQAPSAAEWVLEISIIIGKRSNPMEPVPFGTLTACETARSSWVKRTKEQPYAFEVISRCVRAKPGEDSVL